MPIEQQDSWPMPASIEMEFMIWDTIHLFSTTTEVRNPGKENTGQEKFEFESTTLGTINMHWCCHQDIHLHYWYQSSSISNPLRKETGQKQNWPLKLNLTSATRCNPGHFFVLEGSIPSWWLNAQIRFKIK